MQASSHLSVVDGAEGGYVRITADPFKTGNKHFYNMLRPALYQLHYEREADKLRQLAEVTGLSHSQVQNLKQEAWNRPSNSFNRADQQLTASDIRLLNGMIDTTVTGRRTDEASSPMRRPP